MCLILEVLRFSKAATFTLPLSTHVGPLMFNQRIFKTCDFAIWMRRYTQFYQSSRSHVVLQAAATANVAPSCVTVSVPAITTHILFHFPSQLLQRSRTCRWKITEQQKCLSTSPSVVRASLKDTGSAEN